MSLNRIIDDDGEFTVDPMTYTRLKKDQLNSHVSFPKRTKKDVEMWEGDIPNSGEDESQSFLLFYVTRVHFKRLHHTLHGSP